MSILRQDIIDAIITRFSSLTTPTYHTNLSGKVYSFFSKAGDLSAVVDVQDKTQTIDEMSGAKWDRRMTVDIHITIGGDTSEKSGRALIEDMYKAVGTDRTWGGLAADTVAKGDELDTAQEGHRVTGATITIEILYRTGAWAES